MQIGYHLGLLVLVSALAHIPIARAGRHPVEVLPLAGEPFDGKLNRLSSTSLAQQLMTTLYGRSPQAPMSLTLVPAVRPHAPRSDRDSDFEKYLLQIPSYRAIFGAAGADDPARITRLDAILTGISHIGFPWGLRQRRMYPEQAELDALRDAIGDLGGVLLVGSNDKAKSRLIALQERWTGLQPQHLKNLALAGRAAASKSPRTTGVICVAAGERKPIVASKPCALDMSTT